MHAIICDEYSFYAPHKSMLWLNAIPHGLALIDMHESMQQNLITIGISQQQEIYNATGMQKYATKIKAIVFFLLLTGYLLAVIAPRWAYFYDA